MFMQIINNGTIVVFNSQELCDILEGDNSYYYIYIGDNISLEKGININDNKKKIIINGTYNDIKYTLTGMNSNEVSDTICAGVYNKEIEFKNINIEYTNSNGCCYVPVDKSYSVLVTYNNVVFNGTQLSFNPYGTTKIVDSIITIKDMNDVTAQEVCESNTVIMGGNTMISSASTTNSLFYFRSDTSNPSVVFLCKSRVNITSDFKEFMGGTYKLNFTILHDTEVNLVTANGFSANTIQGANNVLIDERATFIFIENNHKRIPMWAIYGSLTMKQGSNLQLINSYSNTPSDNYNIHFKGSNCKLTLDNPNSFVIYTKNANVIYATNPVEFKIKASRINIWVNSTDLTSAGDIYDLPDYSWYKENDLMEISGIIASTATSITSMNLTSDELKNLPDIGNFAFQNRKEFSIGSLNLNIHPVDSSSLKLTGHVPALADVFIKYDDNAFVTTASSDGLFEAGLPSTIKDNTEVEIIVNKAGSFIYETRKIITPYTGELTLMNITVAVSFSLTPISSDPNILSKDKDLVIEVVDSRKISSDWKLYAYIKKPLTSINGFFLNDALIFKKFDDEKILLTDTPSLVYNGSNNLGDANFVTINWSKEKGVLLDLTDKALQANEEYFANVYFIIEE